MTDEQFDQLSEHLAAIRSTLMWLAIGIGVLILLGVLVTTGTVAIDVKLADL